MSYLKWIRGAAPAVLILSFFLYSAAGAGAQSAAGAVEVVKVAELKPQYYSSFFSSAQDALLHPEGYVYIGREWLRDANNKATAVAFAYAHLPSQKTGSFELPLMKLKAENAKLLTRGRFPSANLVAFDGRRAGFVLQDSRRANKESCVFHGWDRRHYFVSLDTRSGELSELREIGAPGVRESFYAAGADDEYLYYALYSNEGGCGQYKSVRMNRVSLDSLEIDEDWQIDLKTKGVIAKPKFTGDRKYLAILNYTERGVAAKNPPDGFFVEIASRKQYRFTLPVTPYAFACTPAECLVGSSQAGTIVRLPLDGGKSKVVAKGLRLMNHFVVTPGGKRALIFWNAISGPKHVAVRDFPQMGRKNEQKLSTGKVFGAPRGFRPESMVWSADGRYLLIPKPEQSGFADDESILIFEVKD
ncbi:MAG: hypothetical protein NXI24_11285 [bacterium]|nr:hypothetical protein [bacterium]